MGGGGGERCTIACSVVSLDLFTRPFFLFFPKPSFSTQVDGVERGVCVSRGGQGGGGGANENINTIWPTINESQRRRNWVLTAFLECSASCEARPQLTLTQRCVDYQEGISSEYYELSYTCYCVFTGPLSLTERAIKPFDCLKWPLPGHCRVQAL